MLLSEYRKLAKNLEGMERHELLFEIFISIGSAVDKYIFDMGEKIKNKPPWNDWNIKQTNRWRTFIKEKRYKKWLQNSNICFLKEEY